MGKGCEEEENEKKKNEEKDGKYTLVVRVYELRLDQWGGFNISLDQNEKENQYRLLYNYTIHTTAITRTFSCVLCHLQPLYNILNLL